MRWLGNLRYPPETMSDLSDAEWLQALREHYGAENLCFYRPQDGGMPWRPADEWESMGVLGIYLKE